MRSTALLLLLLTATGVHAGDWPGWRGPLFNGVSPDGDPPVEWSETLNVRFKVAIPGRGLSSPIVQGDRLFVMSAMPVDAGDYAASLASAEQKRADGEWPPDVRPVRQRFIVMALSRHDGSLIWQRTATERVPHESHYVDSSWSAASPLTDGERLIAHFGSNGTYAYDLDGQLLWQVDLGDQTTRRGFGEGSSPALDGDTLVINWDHEGDSFVVALDVRDGSERWRTARPDEVTSWATPLIVEHAGRKQVVIPATGRSRGYDLATGKELWSLSGMTVNTIPSAVHRDGVVYLTSGYRGTMLQAVSLERAHGKLEGSDAVLWQHERDTPYVPSPLLYEGRLYFLKHFRNILSVLDAATGKPLRDVERLTGLGDIWASPVAAAGRLYFFDRNGTALVARPGETLEILATNELDGVIDATPAISGTDLFVRTRTHLYRIGTD